MLRLSLLLLLVVGISPLLAHAQDSARLKATRAYLPITDHLTTSGQIAYDAIADIRAAGYEVVINLAVADPERNGEEGFRVIEEGMTYLHIPVSWQEPALRDLDLFFDLMDANRDRKVYVHCFANMRVAVFVYLYRTLRLGVPEADARADLLAVWDPATQEQWAAFIEQAKAAYGS